MAANIFGEAVSRFILKAPEGPPVSLSRLLLNHTLTVVPSRLKEAQGKEKNGKKRMKQGPSENITLAVLKQLLKDQG